MYITDHSPKADSIHDSSSGFASDAPSYHSPPSTMSTFKGGKPMTAIEQRSDEREKERERGGKPDRGGYSERGGNPASSRSSASSTLSYKLPHHYHPQELNMHYRMSTPSPMSNRSGSSLNTPSSVSHVSSQKSSHKSSHVSTSSSQRPKPPPIISYKNPAYEYQLDKHMEEIQNNIKRIELQDTDKIISSRTTKYKNPRMSVFDLLTDAVIVRMFSNLTSDQLCRCSRVCQRWYRLVWDPILWKHIVINSEKINVDKAVKYLTKRLSYNTPTVCVIVEKINLNGCERLSNKGLHTIAKRCPELRELKLQACSNITNQALFEVTSYCVNLEHLDVTGKLYLYIMLVLLRRMFTESFLMSYIR